MVDWFEEIDLGVSGPPVAMSVRNLNRRPWLIQDENEQMELLLKKRLRKDSSKEVFLSQGDTRKTSENVVDLIRSEGRTIIDSERHPLDRAGLSIQEDLCLLHRNETTWVLKAASLCFPSRWILREKIGKGINAVHGPVEDYPEYLETKVSSFMDRLGTDPVWRRNWFIHPDNNLHQPRRPVDGDPTIPSVEIGEKLFVRSERQTLRKLENGDWILFTIRVQQTQLKNFIQSRFEEFRLWVREAPETHHDHKGLSKEQAHEIRKGLESDKYSKLACPDI